MLTLKRLQGNTMKENKPPSEDDVLRRMLNTPPKPFTPKKAKKNARKKTMKR